MNARGARIGALLTAAASAGLLACGPATQNKAPPNPVRAGIEQAIKALPASEPLRLRYNPAACNCPVFELRIGDRWRRASWSNADAEPFAETMKAITASDPERWPIHLLVQATVDPDIARTAQGDYAVRFEVTKLLSGPTAKPGTPPPAAPPGAATPTGS